MTVTVITPAASRLLSTLDRIKLELGVTDDANDAWLLAKLAEVSDEIATFCRRAFGRTVVSESFRLDFRSEERFRPSRILLRYYPVVSITSVTEADEALTTADWEITGDAGVISRLDGSDNSSWWATGKTDIVYTYGWLLPGEDGRDLPYDIEAAALLQMKSVWFARSRDPLVKSISLPDIVSKDFWVGSLGPANTGALHPDAAAKLQKYVVTRIG